MNFTIVQQKSFQQGHCYTVCSCRTAEIHLQWRSCERGSYVTVDTICINVHQLKDNINAAYAGVEKVY